MFSKAHETVQKLVEDFAANEKTYLDAKYSEAQARLDFIDKFWIALGWDVNHEREKNPYEQEVKVERGVAVSNRLKKADYAFFAAPNFRDVKFYVEAKKPSRNLDNADDYFQTIRYGWSSDTPLAVLTDFEQFRVLDCRYKPNIATAENFAIESVKFNFRDYADEEKFRKIYHLFSRESVLNGAIENYVKELPKRGRGAKQGKLFATAIQKSVDESFLDDLDAYRAELARSFKNKNVELDGEELTEAVTRTIDRLVFIRFLEDKLIEPETMIDKFDSWADFIRVCKNLESRYNGITFKNHFTDKPNFTADEKVFADICAELSPKDSPYNFNYIPVHILGSIYERFLGKVIVATDKRAKVEEKPEVRKAGGVYYTPEYIVRYIVENTIGKLLEDKGRNPRVSKGAESLDLKNSRVSKGAESLDLKNSRVSKGAEILDLTNLRGNKNAESSDNENESTLTNVRVSAITPDDVKEMNFADIACGSGSFLLGIYDYLLRWHTSYYNSAGKKEIARKAGCIENADGSFTLTIAQRREILKNNVYGVDVDAQAVEVAQLSLALKLLEDATTATTRAFQPKLGEKLLPDMTKNIVCGNSLVDWDILDGQLFERNEERKLNPMSYEAKFPDIMRRGGFDAIVGNPPWGAEFNDFELDYHRIKNSEIIVRMIDSFMYFVYQGFKKLTDKGHFGMILPDVILYQLDNRKLREYLLKHTKLNVLLNMGDVFEGVTRPTSIITFEKKTDFKSNQVLIADFSTFSKVQKAEKLPTFDGFERFNQDEFLTIPNTLFITSAPERYNILKKVKEIEHLPLSDFVDKDGIQRGVSPDLKEAFIVKKETALDWNLETFKLQNVLTGGRQVKRYFIEYPNLQLIYSSNSDDFTLTPNICAYINQFKDKITCKEVIQSKHSIYSLHRARNPSIFSKEEKIIGVITEDEIIVSLDTSKTFVTDGLYLFGVRQNINLRYLLGILNSKLFVFLYRLITSESGRVLAQVKPTNLIQLPIRTIDFKNPSEKAMHDKVVSLVEQMLEAKKQLQTARSDRDKERLNDRCNAIDRQIDNLVYELYGITSQADKDIIEGN